MKHWTEYREQEAIVLSGVLGSEKLKEKPKLLSDRLVSAILLQLIKEVKGEYDTTII